MVGPSTGQQPESETDRTNRKDIAIATMEARIESLETQLTAKDQQIDQLHQPASPDWPSTQSHTALLRFSRSRPSTLGNVGASSKLNRPQPGQRSGMSGYSPTS